MAPVDKLPIWVEKFQYTNFVGVDYDTAFEELVAALTPPNPLQDLLEQQMAAYQEHGELLGEALLRVFEEKRDRRPSARRRKNFWRKVNRLWPTARNWYRTPPIMRNR